MAVLPIAVALQLALVHAPGVAPETLLAFGEAESGLNPLAIHDNTTRKSYFPKSRDQAVALAGSLLDRKHSLDLGLMQINSANMERTSLTVESAFDPGRSMKAAEQILIDAYRQCETNRTKEDTLRCMASIYNTGRERAGILNGYVDRVWLAAERIVPAIRDAAVSTQAPASAPPPTACGPPPPSWDGWAVSTYQQCLSRQASKMSSSQ